MGTQNKRWREADAREVLTDWRESGLALSRYEREMGLSSNRLRWWKRKAGAARAPVKSSEPRFVPAVVTLSGGAGAVATVRAAGGVYIEVADTAAVPAQWLAAVARELARG